MWGNESDDRSNAMLLQAVALAFVGPGGQLLAGALGNKAACGRGAAR